MGLFFLLLWSYWRISDMSSWKNASKASQRTHRERHQPQTREHLGLLEKKKDYKKRAQDFQEKQATLKLLRKRALDRNPDEFYFHMINSRVTEGEHMELPEKLKDEDTQQQEKLINTQDLKYVTMKRAAESKKLQRLQSELHLLDVVDQTPNQHMFFVDSKKEAKNFDAAVKLNTHPSLLNRRTNRIKLDALKSQSLRTLKVAAQCGEEKAKQYKQLATRVEREKELRVVEQKLYIKRQLLKKSSEPPVKKSAGSKDAPPVYKWKYDRKR